LKNSTLSAESVTRQLCLKCGLCCNGVIFADVELQRGDDAKRLRVLGVPVTTSGKFPQPCHALSGCHCQIYRTRPKHCRQFECLLFKRVLSGETNSAAALRLIKKAKNRADKVRDLLAESGDTNERLALSVRFRQVTGALSKGTITNCAADAFGRLTLAMQDLNLLLGEEFYPGSYIGVSGSRFARNSLEK
jgi:Fe-S-cluster containining protein